MHKMNWLEKVEKPARYTGGELNMIVKDTADKLRFALCFPDTYEVGMSHLGSRILYHVLNDLEFVACERAYTPWIDAQQAMVEAGQKLFALESGDGLDQFDILGFSLSYEMSYTNVLNMLALSGLPLRAQERDERHPLVVAGGSCALHAEAMAPFFDLMLLGDGEQTVVTLAQAVAKAKAEGTSRAQLLKELCTQEGFYVPSLYDVSYHEDGTVAAITPQDGAPPRVRRAIVRDLETAPFPTDSLVPNLQIIHDRDVIELFRGCTRGCRFCQAGFVYRPVRERSLETLADQAERMMAGSGYEELSLMSLSTGDYSKLLPLITRLNESLGKKRIALSLPSMRIDSFVKDMAEGASKVRKTGLTFAPEAGTQRLRDVINKGVSEQDLLDSVMDAFEAGYSTIKLYFMIGLPTETEEDLLGIIELGRKVVELYYTLPKEQRTQPPQVTLSVSPFVPKPFTPFMWEGQDTLETLRHKQQLLRDAAKPYKRLRVNCHDLRLCVMEGVFARGDRRLADVVQRAYELGARMDGWTECFRYDLWMQAMEHCGLSVDFYANRTRTRDELSPYAHIDVGVSDEYLWAEWQRAQAQAITPDCRGGCQGCGLEAVCGGQP